MAIDPQVLFEETKCYTCHGISQAEALVLALLNRIASATSSSYPSGTKFYRALLEQTGTNAPVATVIQNTLGGVVVWTREDPGTYRATLSGAFPVNKTFILTQAGRTADVVLNCYLDGQPNSFQLDVMATGVQGDDFLSQSAIEIIVFP